MGEVIQFSEKPGQPIESPRGIKEKSFNVVRRILSALDKKSKEEKPPYKAW